MRAASSAIASCAQCSGGFEGRLFSKRRRREREGLEEVVSDGGLVGLGQGAARGGVPRGRVRSLLCRRSARDPPPLDEVLQSDRRGLRDLRARPRGVPVRCEAEEGGGCSGGELGLFLRFFFGEGREGGRKREEDRRS